MFVIRILARAAGVTPANEREMYVKAYDPDAFNGRGHVEFTPNPKQALMFDTTMAAIDFYRQQSRVKPTRPDGRPNRPLTAWHAEVIVEPPGLPDSAG